MADIERIESLFQELLREQAAMKEQVKGALKRIDEQTEIEKSVHRLATSVELLAQRQEAIERTVTGIKKDIEEIKQKPGKRWDTATTVIITAVVSGICAFLLTKFGIK